MKRWLAVFSVVFVAAFSLVAATGQTTPPRKTPPASPLTPAPTNDDCLACHGDPDVKSDAGRSVAVDAAKFAGSVHGALDLKCIDCHADLKTVSDFPHESKLAKADCTGCHADRVTEHDDSIHGRAVRRSGLVVAATCTSCHGSHDIRETSDPGSRVFRQNIPTTCGTCHLGIKTLYYNGVHGAASAKGNDTAPVCVDCHTAHQIQRADQASWKLDAIRECGTCHADKIATYRDTFHGQVTSLGFVRVAACADCHGAHDIHGKADPRSTVAASRILDTCRKCHATANANFARYDPHADKHDRARNPTLFVAAGFMKWLLVGVFGVFGLHAVLWFPRGFRERRRKAMRS